MRWMMLLILGSGEPSRFDTAQSIASGGGTGSISASIRDACPSGGMVPSNSSTASRSRSAGRRCASASERKRLVIRKSEVRSGDELPELLCATNPYVTYEECLRGDAERVFVSRAQRKSLLSKQSHATGERCGWEINICSPHARQPHNAQRVRGGRRKSGGADGV